MPAVPVRFGSIHLLHAEFFGPDPAGRATLLLFPSCLEPQLHESLSAAANQVNPQDGLRALIQVICLQPRNPRDARRQRLFLHISCISWIALLSVSHLAGIGFILLESSTTHTKPHATMKSPRGYTPLPFVCLLTFAISVCGAKDQNSSLDLARELNQAFVEVAEKVSPTVVVITVVQKPSAAFADDQENDPFEGLPPELRRQFRKQLEESPPERSQGEGSGIIIRSNGYILTNRHVVEDAERIEVRLQDGRTFKATLRGADPKSHLAVVKIEATGLPGATLAESNKTRVCEVA